MHGATVKGKRYVNGGAECAASMMK